VTAELPLIALLRAPDAVREDVLRTFGDNEEAATRFAIQWAWNNRRDKSLTKSTAAERIGIPNPHFTNIINGKKYLPPHKINSYEWVVGNKAVSMTIDRFRVIREQEQTRRLAELIAKQIVAA
jgi:plasmid maintenance system antidote protein VapI